MKQPEKYFCDMCGTEIMSTSGFISQRIPVVTEFEWTEGHPEPPHVDTLQMDLCKDCYLNAFNIHCGYRGQNPRWRHREECGQWEAENEKLRAELEQVKAERDAAVENVAAIIGDVEEIRRGYGVDNADADDAFAGLCESYCDNYGHGCYKEGSNGYYCANFKWRGQKET